MSIPRPTRRTLLKTIGSSVSVALLAACDKTSSGSWFDDVLASAEGLSRRVQRLLTGPAPLAREYAEEDISQDFRVNGSTNPSDPEYLKHVETGFADWKLEIGGLVKQPYSLSLADLRQMPARTQITRHDCVEGWSSIGKWSGAKLSSVLDRAGPLPNARYVMFFCADSLDGPDKYYESLALEDAYHPQSILAYDFADKPLPIAHGAPLRLRMETQLGYKQAKYVMRLELVDSFARFGKGNGGFWEDRGYEWYAGI